MTSLCQCLFSWYLFKNQDVKNDYILTKRIKDADLLSNRILESWLFYFNCVLVLVSVFCVSSSRMPWVDLRSVPVAFS